MGYGLNAVHRKTQAMLSSAPQKRAKKRSNFLDMPKATEQPLKCVARPILGRCHLGLIINGLFMMQELLRPLAFRSRRAVGATVLFHWPRRALLGGRILSSLAIVSWAACGRFCFSSAALGRRACPELSAANVKQPHAGCRGKRESLKFQAVCVGLSGWRIRGMSQGLPGTSLGV